MNAHTPTLPADHQIGANNPPEDAAPDPFMAHKVNIEDLCDIEARNWLDGDPIATPEQAEKVQTLRRKIDEAEAAADASRVIEKTPWDEGAKAVQDKYNPLIASAKNKVPGKCAKTVALLDKMLTAWLLKVKAEQDAKAEELRLAAKKAADEAVAAVQATQGSTDIEAREEAEAKITEATKLNRAATQAEAAKPVARGYGRAIGLKDNYVVKGFIPVEQEDGTTIPGATAAFRFYWATNRKAIENMVLDLARTDVRLGKRSIPGIIIANEPSV